MFLSRCFSNSEASNDLRGNLYIGSAGCKKCHSSIYNSYVATSHFNSTQTASVKNIYGSFTAGENTFIVNPETKIVMEQRDSGLFQVLHVKGKEEEVHRMDITFGIKHAQTFLSWQGTKAFELPISYYTSVHTWASSPGYSSVVNFTRSIGIGCFECHSSYIKNKIISGVQGFEEALDKNSLVNGIDCERCHGPAANHVNYHLAYPEIKQAKYIVTSSLLSRRQKLDACAVCHSGNDIEKEVSTFNFKIGDTLANFFSPWATRRDTNKEFDVHGNQYNLMARSKCFLESKTLTCSTCHSPHTNAGADLSEYSKKCISCHANTDHSFLKMDPTMANTIKINCIDCHMPEQLSRAITFQLAGSNLKSAYILRTHKIAIYSNPKKDMHDPVSLTKHNNKK